MIADDWFPSCFDSCVRVSQNGGIKVPIEPINFKQRSLKDEM